MTGPELLAVVGEVSGQLGLNIAANVLYDGIKKLFTSETADRGSAERELDTFLKLHGAKVSAATVITALASKGVISIKGSTLYAPDEIRMGAGAGASFHFGDNSTSTTDKTKIVAGRGASIQGSNAEIRQNPDGSIDFLTGPDK